VVAALAQGLCQVQQRQVDRGFVRRSAAVRIELKGRVAVGASGQLARQQVIAGAPCLGQPLGLARSLVQS
jgi:hypothetical protein